AEGAWAVALGGAYPGEFRVTIDYEDATASGRSSWMGYYDGTTPFTFAFTVDAQSPERLAVLLAPSPPEALQAEYAAGLTLLSWEASGDPGVTAYAVYGQLVTDSRLAPLGTSPTSSFATGHDWTAEEGDPARLYAVAARYADGREGFLSSVARNDDRDHDGLRDSDETRRGTGISDPDTDDDGLTDGAEEGLGTDPFDADSDGDGFADASEVSDGSNPLDPLSTPGLFSDGFETGGLARWSLVVG
ncbi:MAG: thrombospondin type 3 repeat-containing protein, partial [Thermoanaerobaculia bacterium]|nr:thrombospondin type 3 repeat-containing protein [Thermoanaerobaculia bacterium]